MSADRFTLCLIFAIAAALLPSRARAGPATPEEAAAMAVEALKSQVDDTRERNLKAKARLFMLQAAMTATRSYAQDPKQAVANAEKAAQGLDEAERALPMEFEEDELLTSAARRRPPPSVVTPKSTGNPWDPPEPPRPVAGTSATTAGEPAVKPKTADASSSPSSAEKAEPAAAASGSSASSSAEVTAQPKAAATPATPSSSAPRR